MKATAPSSPLPESTSSDARGAETAAAAAAPLDEEPRVERRGGMAGVPHCCSLAPEEEKRRRERERERERELEKK